MLNIYNIYMHIHLPTFTCIFISVSLCMYWKPWVHIGTSCSNPTLYHHSSFSQFYAYNSLLQEWETWLLLPPICLRTYSVLLFIISLPALPVHCLTQLFSPYRTNTLPGRLLYTVLVTFPALALTSAKWPSLRPTSWLFFLWLYIHF